MKSSTQRAMNSMESYSISQTKRAETSTTMGPSTSHRTQSAEAATIEDTNYYASGRDSNTFLCFDFNDKAVNLTSCTMQSNKNNNGSNNIKNLVIEASNDKQSWEEIDSHQISFTHSQLKSKTTTFIVIFVFTRQVKIGDCHATNFSGFSL